MIFRRFCTFLLCAVLVFLTGLPGVAANPNGRALLTQRALQIVSPPANFAARWTPPFRIYQSGRSYSTDFGIASVKPSIATQYFIDPQNVSTCASDSNDGLQRTCGGAGVGPLLSASACIDNAPAGATIGCKVINLTSDFIARGSLGWNNTQSTKNLVFEVEGSFRFISAGTTATTALTFTKTVGQTIVYEVAFAASGTSVGDISSKTFLTNPATGAATGTPPVYFANNKVASIAAVNATPGTWFLDTTAHILYVSTFDSRAPDNSIIVSGSANNGRMGTTNGLTIWVSGVDFVGGTTAFLALTGGAANTAILAFSGCSFQNTSAGNALSISGIITAYIYFSGAYYSFADGFNYHSFNGDGTTSGTSPFVFEWQSASIGAGTTGSAGGSDNASTSHDFDSIVRLNNVYINSDDRTVADTNSSFTWNLGLYVGQPITVAVGAGATSAQLTSKVWYDGATIATGSSVQVDVTSTAFYGYRNMLPPSKSGTGSLTPY